MRAWPHITTSGICGVKSKGGGGVVRRSDRVKHWCGARFIRLYRWIIGERQRLEAALFSRRGFDVSRVASSLLRVGTFFSLFFCSGLPFFFLVSRFLLLLLLLLLLSLLFCVSSLFLFPLHARASTHAVRSLRHFAISAGCVVPLSCCGSVLFHEGVEGLVLLGCARSGRSLVRPIHARRKGERSRFLENGLIYFRGVWVFTWCFAGGVGCLSRFCVAPGQVWRGEWVAYI